MNALVGFLIGGVLSMLPHLVVADDGRTLYCDQVGFYFTDSFDDHGNWLSGSHVWTCDGSAVRTETFTSEAADLGLTGPDW